MDGTVKTALLLLLLAALPGGRNASAQEWDNACPAGTSAGNSVRNPATGHLQPSYCVNQSDGSMSSFPLLPSGIVALILSGSCPSGWSEVAALNGKMLRGTVAANNDVGTSGGNSTITPTGSVAAPTFTGNAGTVPAETFTGNAGTVPAQTFTGSSATTSAVSAGTPAGTNGASATSGNCAATNIAAGTGSTTACKATAPNLTVTAQTFTGSALATHTHTLTATGTNGTVSFTPVGTNGTVSFTPSGTNSSPTFTGNAIDPSPSYVKVIFCSKN